MDLFMIVDVLVAGCGVYCLGQWWKLKQAGHLVDCKVIFPNGCNAANCRDPEGFYTYIMPRFLIFSLVTFFSGLFATLNDLLTFLPSMATLVANLIFFLFIVYFGVITSRCYKRFFQ